MNGVNNINSNVKPAPKSILDKAASFSPSRAVSAAAFILFLALSAVVSCFHEPWFDEAQAWMIGRDASYYDMIFFIPHYEGHPPLWSLILSVPAKLGLPYELSLSAIMLIISGLCAYLIIFRSPFCGAVRLTLPFTYFLFYQYGMLARPYGLMTLGFILAAMSYKNRNVQPLKYVLSLLLLCHTGAYGIVISGGLAMVWCAEIIKEYGIKGIFAEFWRTRRFVCLLLLLLNALALICLIIPYEDTYTNKSDPLTVMSMLKYLWYMLFVTPADAMAFGAGYSIKGFLQYNDFSLDALLTMSTVGLLITAVIADNALRCRKLAVFVLPYGLLAIFGAVVYFFNHHVGIIEMFFLFIMWICYDDRQSMTGVSFLDRLTPKISMIGSRSCTAALAAVCISISIVWSISASLSDIRCDYYFSRAAADFLKDNGLENLNIMSVWVCEDESNGRGCVSADIQHPALSIDPYFDENIFFNFNYGNKDNGYVLHRTSAEENAAQYAEWRKTVPDILMGEPELHIPYGINGSVRKSDYILVKTIEYNQNWKLNYASNFFCIYMRKDLFKDYPQIKPENPNDYQFITQDSGQ